MPGLAPLDLTVLAAKAHARGGVTGAMVHGFNRWEWSRASFAVAGETWTADIDALAVRAGAGAFARLDRTKSSFPPAVNERIGTSYSSVCGTLVRVEIDRKSGRVRVAKAYSVVECGQALVPEVVVGQAQGGFAMGVGYALLESLPLYEGGPGDGKWNLDRYLITRASDLPMNDLEIEVLPSARTERHTKGYRRSRDDSRRSGDPERDPRRDRSSLPILAGYRGHDQRSAAVTTINLTINGKPYGPFEVRDELSMIDFLREYLGLTGTKFGCGVAQCLSCAVIVDNPDGTSQTSPTCIVPAVSFAGKSIRTVEGHAQNGQLSALQKAFVEHFSFQCGYCTAGFLNEGQVLLERLAKSRVPRAELDQTIQDALDGHLCRCTGYIKYHEAVRDVILSDPTRYLS